MLSYIFFIFWWKFETTELANDFCTTNILKAEIKEDETYGKYLEANSDENNNGSLKSKIDLNVPSIGNYILEFDAAIANSSSSKVSSTFSILTDSSNTSSYLLKLNSNTQNYGTNKLTWKINDSDSTIQLPQGFLHFILFIERTKNQIGLSIFSLNNEIILEKKIIEKNSSSTSDSANCFYMSISKYYRGLFRLNNISVYSYDNMEINPKFNQKELKISLDSDLLIINRIVNMLCFFWRYWSDFDIYSRRKNIYVYWWYSKKLMIIKP